VGHGRDRGSIGVLAARHAPSPGADVPLPDAARARALARALAAGAGLVGDLRGKWALKGKPALGGEGELLLGGLPGDGRGRAHGTGRDQLVRLPAYSPDFNPDEAIWAWAREEVTANTCLGTKAKVQEQMAQFFARLPGRSAEVQSRCRRTLQALAEAATAPPESHQDALHGDPIGASV
jgi:hypothetical protein